MLIFLLVCYAFLSGVVLLLVFANQHHIRNVTVCSDPNVGCEHKACMLLNCIGAGELFDSVLLYICLRKLSSFSEDLKLKKKKKRVTFIILRLILPASKFENPMAITKPWTAHFLIFPQRKPAIVCLHLEVS